MAFARSEAELVDRIVAVGARVRLTGRFPEMLNTLNQRGFGLAEIISGAHTVGASEVENSRINCRHWSDWNELCEGWNDERLEALFLGLASIERTIRLSGGSVAAAIWIFRILDQRLDVGRMFELAELTFDGINEYTPFGSYRLRTAFVTVQREAPLPKASTFLRSLEIVASGAGLDRGTERTNLEIGRKAALEKARLEREDRRNALRNSREAEIEHAQGLAPALRLRWLTETSLPLPAIPSGLFPLDIASDPGIILDLRAAIHAKVKGAKGYWRTFADALSHNGRRPL